MADKQYKYNEILDVKGLQCPLPLLKAKAALKEMSPDEVLYVIATDKGAWHDFHAFVQQAGFILQEAKSEGDVFHFWIQKT